MTDYHILIRSMTQVSWSEHNILFRGLVMMGKPESVSRRQMVAHNDPTNKEASDHLRGKSRGSGGLARIPEGIGLSQGKTSESRWQGR